VLMACHCPDEHSQIILILDEEGIPERAACLRVLNFSWDDLGMRVAACWHMPRAVGLSMDASAMAGATPLDQCLASITNYGHNLTRALYRKGAAIDTMHLETALNPAGQPAVVPVRNLHAIVDLAIAETREMFSALQIPTETLRISSQAERARKAMESKAL
jgi:hypothetical protein